MERENGRSLIQSGREKGRVIYVLLQSDFSHRATREVLELLFRSISIQKLDAGSVISSHRNEEKCMVIFKRTL